MRGAAVGIQRTVIIGAGAVGASTAAQMALRGTDHLLIGRGEQIRRIAESGLRYIRPDGEHTVQLKTAESIESAQLRESDLLLMATKTQHVEAASEQLAWKTAGSVLAADLPVLTLQNGMAAERILMRRFSRVYGGSIRIPASYTETGTVTSGAAPKIAAFVLGRMPTGLDETAQQIAELLRSIDWLVQLDDQVTRWKALKLLHSVKNGLELLQADTADAQQQREQLAELLSREAAAACAAAGIGIASDAERTTDMSQFVIDPATGYREDRQSTLQSFARGAATHEADYLNGEIVQLGALHGVPTPANAALQRALGRAWLTGAQPGSVPVPQVPGSEGSPRI